MTPEELQFFYDCTNMTQDAFQRQYPNRVRFVPPNAPGRPPRSFYNDSQYLTDADFARLYPGRVRFVPQNPSRSQLPQIDEGNDEGDDDSYAPDDEGDDEGDDNEGDSDSTLPYDEDEDFGDLQARLDSLNAVPPRPQTTYSRRARRPAPPPPPLPQAPPPETPPYSSQGKGSVNEGLVTSISRGLARLLKITSTLVKMTISIQDSTPSPPPPPPPVLPVVMPPPLHDCADDGEDSKHEILEIGSEPDDPQMASNYIQSVLPAYFDFRNWDRMQLYDRRRFNAWGRKICSLLIQKNTIKKERKRTHDYLVDLQIRIDNHEHGPFIDQAKAILFKKVTQLQTTTSTPVSVFALPPRIQGQDIFSQVFFRLVSGNGTITADSITFRPEVFLKNCDTNAKLIYACTLMSETLNWFYGLAYEPTTAASLLVRDQSSLVKAIGKANPALMPVLAGFDTSNPGTLFKQAIALLQRTSQLEDDGLAEPSAARKRTRVESFATSSILPCKFGRHCVRMDCDFNHEGEIQYCAKSPCKGAACGLAHSKELKDPSVCRMLDEGKSYSTHRQVRAPQRQTDRQQQPHRRDEWQQRSQNRDRQPQRRDEWQQRSQRRDQQPQRQNNWQQGPQQQNWQPPPQQQQALIAYQQQAVNQIPPAPIQPAQGALQQHSGQAYSPVQRERYRIMQIAESLGTQKGQRVCRKSYCGTCRVGDHHSDVPCAKWNQDRRARRCPKFDKNGGCWDTYSSSGCPYSHALN